MMRARWWADCVGGLFLAALLASPAAAADWFDDFEDGKVDDGNPVTWTPHNIFPGDYFVEEGSYHLAGVDPSADDENLLSYVDSANFTDLSIRTQGITQGSGNLIVVARLDPDFLNGYLGLIDHGGLMQILRIDSGAPSVLNEIQVGETGLNAVEDVLLQLDVFGTDLSLTAWRPNTVMPLAQVTASDDFYPSGMAGLLYNEDALESSGVFRFAQASSLRIVDLLMGDANGDGKVDLNDFGILKDNFGTGTTRAQGDFNGDAKVDLTDFGLLKDNFGKAGTMAVPEPSSWLLAACGLFGVGLLRRGRLGAR
jgi:hypothetical protein